MRDYIEDVEIKIMDEKIIYGKLVKENNIWYTKDKKPEKIVEYFKKYGPEYFGYEWARIYPDGEIRFGHYIEKPWKRNQIAVLDMFLAELHDDYTIHYHSTVTTVKIKEITREFKIENREDVHRFINFILKNYNIFGKNKYYGYVFRYIVNTEKKESIQEIEVLPRPVVRAGYLEGVYKIPITFETYNLEEILSQLNRPKIKGARKLFGPPRGVNFSNVKKVYSDAYTIRYYFNDNENIAFTPGRKVEICYKRKCHIYDLNIVKDVVYAIFEEGTTYIVELL